MTISWEIKDVRSNGLLLTASWIEMVRDNLDLLALSLDGTPESHNRLRGSRRAFAGLRSKLALVRDAGLAFGFIFTLTEQPLLWAALTPQTGDRTSGDRCRASASTARARRYR